MLSERHDNNAISHWLMKWIRSKISCPKIAMTDESKALMMTVIKSFTQYSSLSKYLNVCSSLILKGFVSDLLQCMLRNDFNHTMKLISSWPKFKNSSHRIKNFYLKSIA